MLSSSSKKATVSGPKPRPIEDRFFEKIQEEDRGYNTPCWIWLAYTDYQGYGQFMAVTAAKNPKGNWNVIMAAHRWAYEHWVGPVPDGLELDHLCKVTSCANPYHVEPTTRRENHMRGKAADGSNWRK